MRDREGRRVEEQRAARPAGERDQQAGQHRADEVPGE